MIPPEYEAPELTRTRGRGADPVQASSGGVLLPADELRAAAAAARLSDDDFAVVAALVLSARSGFGWYRRKVRGWHFFREIGQILGDDFQIPCSLTDLCRRRGLFTGLEVRDCANGRVHLYRASDLTARIFDQALGRTHEPLEAPTEADTDEDRRMLFMPLGAWAALSALRDAREKRLLRPRWEEHGWLTAAEIKQVLGDKVWIGTSDLAWLERRKLVERRSLPCAARPVHPPLFWRVTGQGERTRVIDEFGIVSGLNTVLQVEMVRGRVPPPLRHARPLADLQHRYEDNLRRRMGLPLQEAR